MEYFLSVYRYIYNILQRVCRTQGDSLRTGSFARELGKREKKEKVGERGGRKRENELAGMTFNLESFAYRFSMLKSLRYRWSRSVKWVVNRYFSVTAFKSPPVVTQREQSQRYKEAKRFLSRLWKNSKRFQDVVQKPEQKEAIEHLLKGRNILAL